MQVLVTSPLKISFERMDANKKLSTALISTTTAKSLHLHFTDILVLQWNLWKTRKSQMLRIFAEGASAGNLSPPAVNIQMTEKETISKVCK